MKMFESLCGDNKSLNRAVLKLKNNLYFFFNNEKILMINPQNLSYLTITRSDLVMINFLKKTICLGKLLQKTIWFSPQILLEKIKHLYNLGFLEINGIKTTTPINTLADKLEKKFLSQNSDNTVHGLEKQNIKCKNCCWLKICANLHAENFTTDCYGRRKYLENLAISDNNGKDNGNH